MTSTSRTPDDGRNERQRKRDEDTRKERVPDDGRSARQHLEEEKRNPEFIKHMEEERQHPDFIERTRPDDPSDHFGQLTRDNVNPDIPSAPPRTGGIVDPNSLGMPQGREGVAPPEPAEKVEQWPSLGLDHTKDAGDQVQEAKNRQRQAEEGSGGLGEPPRLHSINEPPGSNVLPGEGGPNQIPDGAELPPLVLSDIDPDAMVVGTGTITLTVTGSGFTPSSVVVFDDADVPTTFVSPTELRADCPVAAAAAVVDVEVHRGDDMSDVLSFEFTAVMREGREKKPPQRKPKKEEPRHKRRR